MSERIARTPLIDRFDLEPCGTIRGEGDIPLLDLKDAPVCWASKGLRS